MNIIREHFESLTSTNDRAKERLRTLHVHELLIVTADMQTAGRGQYGRSWLSVKSSSLIVSFAFIAKAQDPLLLTRTLSLATQRVLQEIGIESSLKWPNDLLVRQKKIAGILCETIEHGIVIGLGLNVNLSQEELSKIDQPATSILAETGKHHAIESLLNAITDNFMNQINEYYERSE